MTSRDTLTRHPKFGYQDAHKNNAAAKGNYGGSDDLKLKIYD